MNVSTGRSTRKARAIEAACRFSLCAQDERPPYKYVTVEGPASSSRTPATPAARAGPPVPGRRGGDAYMAANPGDTQVMIRMTPEHWLSVDYGRG